MNSSPERNTFHSRCRIEDAIAEGRDPDTDPEVQQTIERERMLVDMVKQKESQPEFKENNLEYDLRNTQWICDKVKASDAYAQNLYAAMCNNEFQKLDVWPLLKGQTYSCSWRYAGGIVADMQEKGDYIDWYCSGIRELSSDQLAEATEIEHCIANYVSESVVTDEIKQDLAKLGWKVVDNVDE
jgi:hypothetical protein